MLSMVMYLLTYCSISQLGHALFQSSSNGSFRSRVDQYRSAQRPIQLVVTVINRSAEEGIRIVIRVDLVLPQYSSKYFFFGQQRISTDIRNKRERGTDVVVIVVIVKVIGVPISKYFGIGIGGLISIR